MGTCKKWLLACLAGLMLFGMGGCFEDPIKDDLLVYLNDTCPDLYDQETSIGKNMDSVTLDNYTDDNTLYYMLVDTVIPDMETFVADLEDVKVDTIELRNVHQKWIDAAKARLQAYKTLQKALEDGTATGIADADKELDNSIKLYQQHVDELKKLANDHHVVIGK